MRKYNKALQIVGTQKNYDSYDKRNLMRRMKITKDEATQLLKEIIFNSPSNNCSYVIIKDVEATL